MRDEGRRTTVREATIREATIREATVRYTTASGSVAAALILFLAAGSAAAQTPADALFSGFELNGEYIFELNGQDLENAEIYSSERAAAYLIMAPELSSPVLIHPRSGSAESVHLMKVLKRPDGTIDLLADATFNRLSSLRIEGTEVHFDIKGATAKLKSKPPLLGLQDAATLQSYKPEYSRRAKAYTPAATKVQALRGADEARILIYFGTWCPTCGRLVPRVLQVEKALQGSKIEFQYYGLPRQIDTDPNAKRDDIHGVPTGIVYVDGKEIGRLEARDLNNPEAGIARMLGAG